MEADDAKRIKEPAKHNATMKRQLAEAELEKLRSMQVKESSEPGGQSLPTRPRRMTASLVCRTRVSPSGGLCAVRRRVRLLFLDAV